MEEIEQGVTGDYLWIMIPLTKERKYENIIELFDKDIRGKIQLIRFIDSGPLGNSYSKDGDIFIYENEISYFRIELNSDWFKIGDEYDEWYVISEMRTCYFAEDYVNYVGFSLSENSKMASLVSEFWDDIIKNNIEFGIINGSAGLNIIAKSKYSDILEKIKSF